MPRRREHLLFRTVNCASLGSPTTSAVVRPDGLYSATSPTVKKDCCSQILTSPRRPASLRTFVANWSAAGRPSSRERNGGRIRWSGRWAGHPMRITQRMGRSGRETWNSEGSGACHADPGSSSGIRAKTSASAVGVDAGRARVNHVRSIQPLLGRGLEPVGYEADPVSAEDRIG